MISHDDLVACVARSRASLASEDKRPVREQIAADVAAYLAQGGRIETPVSEPLRCVRLEAREGYRWAYQPAPVTDMDRNQRRKRSAGQRVVLPGSHTGPKPCGTSLPQTPGAVKTGAPAIGVAAPPVNERLRGIERPSRGISDAL